MTRDRVQLGRFLTVDDLADLLQLSRRTVLKLTRQGEIRCIRIGNRVRYDPDEVARWLKAKGGADE